MTITLHCYHLNELYSQAWADAHNKGLESSNNHKYLWEDQLAVRGVLEYKIEEQTSHNLEGVNGLDQPFCFPIGDMRRVCIETNNGPAFFAFSEEILSEFVVEENEKDLVIRAYFKDHEPFGNPVPGIYMAMARFPKELT